MNDTATLIFDVLELHIFNKALAQCSCGANLADTGHRTRAWRRHAAEVVAVALGEGAPA